MKLVTYLGANGKPALGAIAGTGIVDLRAAAQRAGTRQKSFASMQALIEGGPRALDKARHLAETKDQDLQVPLAGTRLLAPLPVPQQIRDFSVYPLHVTGAPRGGQRMLALARGDKAAADAVKEGPVPQVYRDRPVYYITNRFSVVGHETDVVWPRYSKMMDFELEFACIIGKSGTNLTKRQAKSRIFGYTIFNDFSARDIQFAEMQGMLGPTKGKSFDAGNAMGPCIVTADEVQDPYALKASAVVSGTTWTETSTAGMLHSFEDMIAYVTRDETIHAGEIFGSGTMNGGCGLELERFLRDGDVVELTVEGLGTLRNRVLSRV